MKFSFDVGGTEKQKVNFYFNQFWGNLNIAVDGQMVIRDFRMFSLKLTKVYEFRVGTHERHSVRIEMKRKLFLAGFRPYTYRSYIDNELVKEITGK